MASWKMEVKRSSVLCVRWWLLREQTLLSPLSPPFPASMLLPPGTLLNKVLARKPLPWVLFSGESRLRQMSEQSRRPEKSVCSWLGLACPDIATGTGTGSGGCSTGCDRMGWTQRGPRAMSVKQVRAVCIFPQQ